MKKLLAAALLAMLIFSFSSCENKTSDGESVTAAAETMSLPEETAVSKVTSKPAEINTETTSAPETSVTSAFINTYTEVTDQPYGESVSEQKILMFMIYENLAWGFDRSIAILDSDGNYCIIYHDDEGGEFLSEESGDPLNDENWYQNFVDALEYGKYTWQDASGNEHENKLPDEKLELVKEYTKKFGDYKDAPIRDYGHMAYDSGVYALYGVYLDENNVPQYIKLCADGDWAYCIDDNNIADFVNSINGHFFYSDIEF